MKQVFPPLSGIKNKHVKLSIYGIAHIYWVGLDPRNMTWIAGRHNSPQRKLVLPLRLIEVHDNTKRMLESFKDKAVSINSKRQVTKKINTIIQQLVLFQ